MFPVDFSIFICYYLGGVLLVYFFFLLRGRHAASAKERSAEERLRQCATCTHVYFDASMMTEKISVCPLCGSLNQKG